MADEQKAKTESEVAKEATPVAKPSKSEVQTVGVNGKTFKFGVTRY